MENTPQQENNTTPNNPLQHTEIIPAPQVSTGDQPGRLARKINHVTALVLLFSGIVFVLIAILAIWQVFGPDAGSVIWRSLGSLGVLALGALIVAVSAKLVDDSQQKK